MRDSTFGLPNKKVILKQFVSAMLELLQDIPVQGETANQWFYHKKERQMPGKFNPTALNSSEISLTQRRSGNEKMSHM